MKRFCWLCFFVPGVLFAGEGLSSADFKERLPVGEKSRETFEMVFVKGIRPPRPKKDPKKLRVIPAPKMKTLWKSRCRTLEGSCKVIYNF